jgi:nucleotide-binding universal stress UspA family protein
MFDSIVVGTDGSDTARKAVDHAIDLAHELEARLNVVSAYEPTPAQRLRQRRMADPGDAQWALSGRDEVMAILEEAAEEARRAGVSVELFARQGDAADAIIDVPRSSVPT